MFTQLGPLSLGHSPEDIFRLCIGAFSVTVEERDSSSSTTSTYATAIAE